MEVSLSPTGVLNTEDDINSIPKGDWIDARNIIVTKGVSGGNNTAKLIESIIPIESAQTVSGTFLSGFRDSDGSIYVLHYSTTTATITKFASTLLTSEDILTYTHAVSTQFEPDFKKIGNFLVWNYYGSGTVLIWDVNRGAATITSIGDILLSKQAPIGKISVTKTVGTGKKQLEDNDFQFSCRYEFDSGEFSTLSPFTEMFKGEEGTQSYSIVIDLTTIPAYASYLHIYMRAGSYGSWKRIYTTDSSETFVWLGDSFEVLDSVSSEQTFSPVPISVKTLEVADGHIWLGSIDDEYSDIGAPTLTIGNGYSLATGGSIKNYLGADTTSAAIKSSESGTYYKPFANNSSYAAGIVFFDDSMRTRGVQAISYFQTGNFATNIAPTFTVGGTIPNWATKMQLAVTKNLTKSNIFEGYANAIYFTTEDTVDGVVESGVSLSVTEENKSKIKNLVVDISAMIDAGFIYNFNIGDRITINVPDGTNDGSADADGNYTGAYRLVDLEVSYSDDKNVYCKWSGGLCNNEKVQDTTELYFEIYTPSKNVETGDSLLFYGVGDVIDAGTGSVGSYKIGDTVFESVAFKAYTDQVLEKVIRPTVPASITEDYSTTLIFNATTLNDTIGSPLPLFRTGNTGALYREQTYDVVFDEITKEADDTTSAIDDGDFLVGNYYDTKGVITVSNNFNVKVSLSNVDSSSTINARVYCEVFRIPYNVDTNTYGQEHRMGVRKLILDRYIDGATSSPILYDDNSYFIGASHTVDLSSAAGSVLKASIPVALAYKDKIVVRYTMGIGINGTVESGDAAIIELQERAAGTDLVTLNLTADKIDSEIGYVKRTETPVSETEVTYAFRASSFDGNSAWNTSHGKPYLKASETYSGRRINSIAQSGRLIPNSKVNNLSVFSTLDIVELPTENGEIKSLQRSDRIQGDGNMILAICENEVSYLMLGEYQLSQSNNQGLRAFSSDSVGTIRNITEPTGVKDKESVYNDRGTIYWWDDYRKKLVKFTGRGIEVLSDRKMSPYFMSKSGKCKMVYEPFYKMLFASFTDETIAYSDIRNGWVSKYDMVFGFGMNFGERAIVSKEEYLHVTQGSSYSTYAAHGNLLNDTDQEGYLTFPVNTVVPVSPKWIRINHNANVVDYNETNWVKDVFEINISNENSQSTNILRPNYEYENNKLYAQVLPDGSTVDGNPVIGYANKVKISLKDNTQECRIFAVDLNLGQVHGH